MNSRTRWAFLTFGAGLPNWRAAARRLEAEAKASGWFDVSIALTDRDLPRLFPDFVSAHQGFLDFRRRGFGYWIWKPFLIQQLLADLGREFAGLVYLDAGCQLNRASPDADWRMTGYLEAAREAGTFAMHLPNHQERFWSREVTMDFLGLSGPQRESPQVQATFIATTLRSEGLIRDWYHACSAKEYSYLVDGPADELNSPGFVAHRHDQSILSGLMKTRNIYTIPDETFWAPAWELEGRRYPIWAARNRTRVPVEARGAQAQVVRTLEKGYSRILTEASRRMGRPF